LRLQGALFLIRGKSILYKLIALDLDGTLLNDEKNIAEENIRLLNQLSKNGIKILIATGRGYYSAKQLTKNIKGDLIFVANNGGIVRQRENDQVLFSQFLDEAHCKLVLKEGLKRDLHPIIHIDYFLDGYDIILSNKFIKRYKDSAYVKKVTRYKLMDKVLDEKIDRILALVYPGGKDKLNNFNLYINENYPDRFSSHIMENVEIDEGILELMNPSVNKWEGIKKYARSQGIKEEEIVVIGDDNNDIDMIRNAGLGIAMKNGTALARSIADTISEKDNNQAGVAFELKRVLNI